MQEIWYLVPMVLVLIQFVMVSKWPAVVSKTVHEIQRRIVRLLLVLLNNFPSGNGLWLNPLQKSEERIRRADRSSLIEPGPDGFQYQKAN